MNDTALWPLRQQLSCASKELLESAMLAEIGRIAKLRDEICGLGLPSKAMHAALDKIDERNAAATLALRQLGYVYIDQFERGRAENDSAGRSGLIDGVAPR